MKIMINTYIQIKIDDFRRNVKIHSQYKYYQLSELSILSNYHIIM